MSEIIEAYRAIFLYHTCPNVNGMIYLVIVSVLVLVFGYMIFEKLKKGFAEEV